jgi:hypothetical protein
MTTLSPALIRAIAEAVEHHDGDYTDVEDLIHVWERVQRRNDERTHHIRAQTAKLNTTHVLVNCRALGPRETRKGRA